jgi:hypothetical protein
MENVAYAVMDIIREVAEDEEKRARRQGTRPVERRDVRRIHMSFQPEMTRTVARTGRKIRSGIYLLNLLPSTTPGSEPSRSSSTSLQSMVPTLKYTKAPAMCNMTA